VKKILVIDESPLFREYLSNKLIAKGFEVVQGNNGLDGSVKMRRELPDLIIMDYYLTRKTSQEVLQERKENPNTAKTPVLMVSSKIDKGQLVEIASYDIKKFFTKPLKIDALLKAVAEVLNVTIEMDATPCIVDAHMNEEILFIEIAMGLNVDKIELLQYKITELLELYHIHMPRILLMLANLTLTAADASKIRTLLTIILQSSGATVRNIKVLTNDAFVKEYLPSHPEFAGISVMNNLDSAMDELIGMKGDANAHDQVAGERLLKSTRPKGDIKESIEMRFSDEGQALEELDKMRGHAQIAVVDDDMVIQELVKTVFSETNWTVKSFANGKEFVSSLGTESFDLIFLDLMMPIMDGFQVMDYLKKKSISLPIIVFSALSKKETVVKAVNYGVTSYMIKPLKPEKLLMKAAEALRADF
jgi:DNA-binding response OmpR family regulator